MSGHSELDGEGEAEGPDERWTVSYMDMVTVLMCLFIVLFAMSTVDKSKYEALKTSLQEGFGIEIEKSDGVDKSPPEEPTKEEPTDLELAKAELDELNGLMEAIQARLVAQGLQTTVNMDIGNRGLTIRLVGAETFFQSNSDRLSSTALQVVSAISPALAADSRQISVEGHADRRQSAAPFATNWELSSARATQVLRSLVERGGVAPTRVGAVGFGSARPIAPEDTADAYAANRRVDIIVLSSQPDRIRELLPGLLKQK